MERKYESSKVKVDIPFTSDEAARYREYIKTKKAGQVVRSLLVRAMNEESGLGDGSTQARELAEFVAAHLPPEQLRALAARESGGAA